MGMNFPNSPLPGQVYTPVGGYSYVFLDGVWRIVQNPQGVGTAQERNRIVNGAMQISQENSNTAGTANGYYGADQWQTGRVGTSTLTTQRVASVTPNGSYYRYRVTVTVADASLASGDYFYIRQEIEGYSVVDFDYGLPTARQSILRFGFRGPAGTYSWAFRNEAVDRCYLANFTISAAQANTDTVQVFVIPGDTTGVWGISTGIGITFNIYPAGGPQLLGVANTWQAGALGISSANTNGMATAGNVFEIFDVGLYLDPDKTGVPPKWVMPDFAENYAACLRYYLELGAAVVTTSGSSSQTMLWFPVVMRAAPTVTHTASTGNWVAMGSGGHGVRQSSAATAFGSDTIIANARL
jgi:hypothetical protein